MSVLRLILILIAAALPLRAQEEYEIRLHRPVKVGDRFNVTAKVAVDMTTKTVLNADDVDEETVLAGCRLEGELMVVQTTAKGLVKELRLELKSAESVRDGKDATIFSPGDVIVLRHETPEKILKVNGADPDEVQSGLIETFLSVQGEQNSTDDELLGTPPKVKRGESWRINTDAMLKAWLQEGFTGLKREDLHGTTTLSEITKLNGEPAARLLAEFRVENAGLQLPSLPEEVRAKRFKLEVKDETEMPLDPAALAARIRTHMSLESDSDGVFEEDGRAFKVRVNLRQRCAAEISIAPLK